MKTFLIGLLVGAVVAGGITFFVVRGGDDAPAPSPAPESSPDTSGPSIAPSASASPSPSPTEVSQLPLHDDQPLRMDGLGAITVGMTVEKMEEATGTGFREPSDFGPRCRYAYPVDGPVDVALMLSRGRLVRIDVFNRSQIETVSGIGIGDSEDDVYRAYGDDIEREDHPYLLDQGSYLVYRPDGEDELLLIFETSRGKVQSFRSGREEQVRYIEGCA